MSKPVTPMGPFTLPSLASEASPVKDLALRAAAGDAGATGALLRSIRPGVVAVVRRVIGGSAPADVDDAVQHALIALIQALPAYRGDAEPGAYAKAIAVRAALTVRRRSSSASRRTDDYDLTSLPSAQPSPSDDAKAQQRRALLRQLLDEIPAEQAEALAMRVVLGWSLEEIAASAGVPLNTVRSRTRLAKEALRRKIEAAPELLEALGPH